MTNIPAYKLPKGTKIPPTTLPASEPGGYNMSPPIANRFAADADDPCDSTGYIAVTDELETAGASVWFRLSGDLVRGSLAVEIENRGLDLAAFGPKVATKERCFSRAVKSIFRDKTHNVDSLKGGGFAVTAKKTTDTEVDYAHAFSVKLVNNVVTGVGSRPAGFTECDAITREAIHFDTHLTTDDVSAWLITCAERLGGIPLRERGGFYFIPRPSLPTWKLLVSALKAASGGAHRVSLLPTVKCEDAVEAVLDAVTAECEKFFEKRREEMEKGELGKRAIRTREELSEKLRAKIESYENLLGRKLTELTDSLGEVEVELAAALFAAEAEADKDRGLTPIPLVV